MRSFAAAVASLFLVASTASAQSGHMITVTRAGSQPSSAGSANNFTGAVRVAAAAVTFTAEELDEINAQIEAVQIEGARLPDNVLEATGWRRRRRSDPPPAMPVARRYRSVGSVHFTRGQ